MNILRSIGIGLVAFALLPGCDSQKKQSPQAQPQSMSADAKRTAILTMCTDTLDDLYRQRGTARPVVMQAPGYAVFSDADLPVLKMGSAEGYGAVFDNATHLPTYMKMSQVAGAAPLKLKTYRLVFVFGDRPTMEKFVQQGMQFGADSGPQNLQDTPLSPGEIRIYQLTADGVVPTTVVPMTRYWQDKELNP
jgi:hypothetical protein